MKKALIIIIATLLLAAGGLYLYKTYHQPFKLPTRTDYDKREVTERGRELGWVLGEVLIEFDDNKINLDIEADAKKALQLVKQASDELAPIVVREMVDAGMLPPDYDLKEDLITFGRTIGPNGAVLTVAIDESEDIISEALKKYDGVEDASPNYIGSFF
ncbi:hypothetical protein JW752_03895 [Candidatus Peregrinibacteria bacterium]|nr:hypothetical protein [Candidatus Peregrinibacteria bacterium]